MADSTNKLYGRKYIGDAVYAQHVNGMIKLWIEPSNEAIFLEPHVFENLLQFAIAIGWLKRGQTLE